MAWRAGTTLLRAIPLLAITSGLLPLLDLGDWALRAPPSFGAGTLFAISMIAVLFLSSAITTLLNISVVAMVSEQGINAITNSLVIILSGMVVPLPLFPNWAQIFLLVQPLGGLVDIPNRIYFANLTNSAALMGIGLQIFWTLALVIFGQLLMVRTMGRVQVQGG
jgi:ABC-2 type transport system permease protein